MNGYKVYLNTRQLGNVIVLMSIHAQFTFDMPDIINRGVIDKTSNLVNYYDR